MSDPGSIAKVLERVFERIHRQVMAGIPLLNPAIKVQTLGFQEYQGRVIGILITPWVMNLIMFPGTEDDWDGLELGKKQLHEFPSNTYKFLVNEIDGIGKCQTHSLYSPMREFVNQNHALAAARSFLDALLVETQGSQGDPVDEELLGRILRGEEPTEMGPAPAASNSVDAVETKARLVRERSTTPVSVELNLSRRDLLRGRFSTGV
ncbi:MAG: [NiFe]-hydrogenase assembly chaperone HybE [bacterium]|nr:[NiFe]-hydrogenase assembly chaperone HybE [bacterium]